MSDTPVVKTNRSAPRNELAKFFRGNTRLVEAFEALLSDVGVTLPDAIGNASADASTVLAQSMFSPPQPPAQPINDTASLILASQIFGA